MTSVGFLLIEHGLSGYKEFKPINTYAVPAYS